MSSKSREEIAEYKVVIGSCAADLSEQVNEHIKQGWQPYMGPATTGFAVPWAMGPEVHEWWTQALVKYRVPNG